MPSHRLLPRFVLAAVPFLGRAAAQTPGAGEDQAIQLTPFEVSASSSGYLGAETTTGTRYAAPIAEIPFNVQIVTNEQIEDFQAFDLAGQSAFAYTGSFSNAFPESSTGVITVRGIRGFAIYSNGIREGGVYGPAAIDRIELIEGASDSIYGQAEPSGAINRVTKEGQPKPFQVLSLMAGDNQRSRVMLDVNQPLVGDKLLFRFAASYENSQDFRQQFAHFWRQNLYASMTYRFNPDLVFTAHSDYVYLNSTSQNAHPAPFVLAPVTLNGVAQEVRIGYFGEAPWNSRLDKTINLSGPFGYNKVRYSQTDANLIERYDGWLTVMLLGSYWHRVQENPQDIYSGTNSQAFDTATGKLLGTQSINSQANHQFQANGQVNILADVHMGAVHHKLLLTADYSKEEEPFRYAVRSKLAAAQIPLENYLIGGPYSNPAFPYAVDFGNTAVWNNPTTNQRDTTTTKGLMISERAGFFGDRLIAILGGRHDQLDQSEIDYLNPIPVAATGVTYAPGQLVDFPIVKANTVQAGLVAKLLPQRLVAFASYASDFVPQSGNVPLDVDLNPIPPTRGSDAEFGLKGDLFDHKLSFTTDAYYAKQRNLSSNALDANGNTLFVPGTTIAEHVAFGAKYYGWEVDGTWNPTANLSIWGGIGWTHAAYSTIENPTQEYLIGTAPAGTPAWAGGVAGVYDFAGVLQGWFLQLGLHGQTWELANQSTTNLFSIYGNSGVQGPLLVVTNKATGVTQSYPQYYFKNSGWIIVNPALGYQWSTGRFYHKIGIYFTNVLNRTYFVTAPSGPQIQEGISGNISYSVSWGRRPF